MASANVKIQKESLFLLARLSLARAKSGNSAELCACPANNVASLNYWCRARVFTDWQYKLCSTFFFFFFVCVSRDKCSCHKEGHHSIGVDGQSLILAVVPTPFVPSTWPDMANLCMFPAGSSCWFVCSAIRITRCCLK